MIIDKVSISNLVDNDKITSFSTPEKTSLSNYNRIIPQDNRLFNNDASGGEAQITFRMNQTGNIFYATTSEIMQEKTKDLFDSVTVLFAAMTRAMALSGKTLFDYDAWSKLIGSSGFFVEVQKFRSMIEIKSGSVSVDTQIIQNLLPGLTSGSSMNIAKGVLNSLNGEFSAQGTDENTQLAHVLFICEELFGAPSVVVRLFYASKKTHSQVTSSPCHKSVTKSYEQLQEANSFLFVDPETISKFAKKFQVEPESYAELIEKLKEMIK